MEERRVIIRLIQTCFCRLPHFQRRQDIEATQTQPQLNTKFNCGLVCHENNITYLLTAPTHRRSLTVSSGINCTSQDKTRHIIKIKNSKSPNSFINKNDNNKNDRGKLLYPKRLVYLNDLRFLIENCRYTQKGVVTVLIICSDDRFLYQSNFIHVQ